MAIGQIAMQANTIGHRNIAVGGGALSENVSGNFNACIGDATMILNTTGSFNTAVGPLALHTNTSGDYNTAIGHYADVSSGNLTNATAIGNGTIVNSSNKIRLGNTSVTVVEGNASYTVSDGRFKTDLKQNVPGLDFITRLQPVTYHFDYPAFSNFIGERIVDRAGLEIRKGKVEAGFVAQQVEEVCLSLGMDYANFVHAPENDQDNYSLSYAALVVPLVQAVQEQQILIEDKNEEIRTLQQQLLLFQERLARIELTLGITVDSGSQLTLTSTGTEGSKARNKTEIKSYPLPPKRPAADTPLIPEYGTQKVIKDSTNQ